MKEGGKSLAMTGEPFPAWKYLRVSSEGGPELAGVQRHLFFWARNGIYYSLQALGLRPGVHVLLPAYLCTAAVEPCTEFGAEVEFYGIGRDCQPDFAEIESKVRANTGAVLAVHYFGFPQRIREFRELCTRHRVDLIEDCAHVLQGEFEGQPLGSFGDASVSSLRKFLPLYDGAELRLNREVAPLAVPWDKERILFTLKVAKCLLDRLLEQSSGPVAQRLTRVLESVRGMWRQASGTQPGRPLLALDSNRASFDPSLLNQRISRVSRWLLKHSNVPRIVRQRRENFLFLQKALRGVGGVLPLHPELPANVCPWVYPLVFDGLPNAHLALRKRGIPAATWGGVRPQCLDAKQFADADFLFENLIFLPVHQNLSRTALEQIVEAVTDVASARAEEKSAGYCAVG